MKKIFKALNVALILGLIIVAIGVVFIAFPKFGNQALIVRSGSMAPTIDVGSIVVVRNDQQLRYKSGDIIAFHSEKNSKTVITHRIVSVEKKGNSIFYKTKGDANNTPDGWIVNQRNVLGKVDLTLPFFGKILAFAKSDLGFPVLIIFPSALVILIEILNILREIKKKKQSFLNRLPFGFEAFDIKKKKTSSFLGFKILIPAIALGLIIPGAYAFLNDAETSTNNTFSAAQVFPAQVVINEVYYDVCTPAVTCGNNGQNEWIELYNNTSSPIDVTGWTITDNISTDTIPSATISAHSFLIITPEAHTFDIWSSVPAGQRVILGSNIGNGLSDSGDRVILKNASSETIDAMSWDNDNSQLNPPATDVAKGHSLERDPDGKDTNTASDFVDRTTPQPSL